MSAAAVPRGSRSTSARSATTSRVLKPEGARAHGRGEGRRLRARRRAGGAGRARGRRVLDRRRARRGGLAAARRRRSKRPSWCCRSSHPAPRTAALDAGLTPSLYSDGGLAIGWPRPRPGRDVGVHVKVDTGMHRVGRVPARGDAGVRRPRCVGAGLRLERAVDALRQLHRRTRRPRWCSWRPSRRSSRTCGRPGIDPACSTPRTAAPRSCTRSPTSTWSAPGIAIYGVEPAPGVADGSGCARRSRGAPTVAMTKRLPAGEARVVRTSLPAGARRERRDRAGRATPTATLALLSSRADVLIRGQRCRVAGSVTMDQLIVDCGDLPVEAGRRGRAARRARATRRSPPKSSPGSRARSATRSSPGSATGCRGSTWDEYASAPRRSPPPRGRRRLPREPPCGVAGQARHQRASDAGVASAICRRTTAVRCVSFDGTEIAVRAPGDARGARSCCSPTGSAWT